jgi:hypothetical protein
MSIQDGISGGNYISPMKHEARCIEFPCTCVTILRERLKEVTAFSESLHTESLLDFVEVKGAMLARIDSLEKGHKVLNQALHESSNREISLRTKLAKTEEDKASNDKSYLELIQKYNSLDKKIQDGLSCCCSGCTKHNQNLEIHTFTLDEIDIAFSHTIEKELRSKFGQSLLHTTLSITALKDYLKGSKCENKNDTL